MYPTVHEELPSQQPCSPGQATAHQKTMKSLKAFQLKDTSSPPSAEIFM